MAEVSNGSGGKIVARKCDVTDEAQLLLTFKWIKEEYGRLDVLVNNAGVIKSDLVLGMRSTRPSICPKFFLSQKLHLLDFRVSGGRLDGHTCDFKNIFDVNVIAACICIREAVKLMRTNDTFGHIIVLNRFECQ